MAQSRVWESGSALTLAAHCVSTIATLFHASAAANAGKATANIITAKILFIMNSSFGLDVLPLQMV
jgi:hypothetical protein